MAPDVKIRDLSPEVYARLQERARANGRSMEAELRLLVADAVGLSLPPNHAASYQSGKKTSMSSLVLELQEQALNPDILITDLLRKAKVAAAKLRVGDILEWVTYELEGYPDDDAVIPDYREIRGVAKGFNPLRGWLKIQFENPEQEEQISTQKSRQPISEIETLAEIKDGSLTFIASNALAVGLSNATEARIFVARSQIVRILEAVRNRILSWALALEGQGILGEGFSFSPNEKAQAANSDFRVGAQHYTVYGSVGVIGAVSDSVVSQNTGAQMEPLARALQALSNLAASVEDPGGVLVAVSAERAAIAASSQPNVTLVERLVAGMSSVVQGIAALGPAWTAVTTEAVKLGLNVGLPGSHS
jgi:plasmid stability protein